MHVRRALALAAVVPLFLAGCGGGDPSGEPTSSAPAPTTSAAPTETPTETPTVDPLAIPDAMRDKSLKGAEAAVRHYFDLYNYLIETGDAKPIKKIYGDHCSLCSVYVGLVEVAYERGSTVTGSQTLRSAQAYSAPEGLAAVVGKYDGVRIVEVTSSGKRRPLAPGGKATLNYFLTFQSGRWEILNVEVPRRAS